MSTFIWCYCCWEQLPDTAKVWLCPACFQASTAPNGEVVCSLHDRVIDPKEVTS